MEATSQEKTGLGNYFVANYPPFSFWKPAHLPEAQAALHRPPEPGTPLGLYLHIPFCRKRCKFCYFRVYTDKNARDVETYLDALVHEVELYSRLPIVGGRPLQYVYFGGGTPSFLSTAQLGRLSLGIENFDDQILEANGRAHHAAEIFRAYGWARDAGFDQINIDLIAGMVGETWDNWRDCVRRTIELNPDSVTIYQMELPFNTVFSRELRVIGQDEPGTFTVADWPTKRAWVRYAFEELGKAGYEVSSAYTVVKDRARCRFVYRDSLWHGADMFGTGVASFGHANGVHMQNVDTWGPYVERLQQGELPLQRALPIGPRERLIREMILQLKTGRLDSNYFRGKFHTDVLATFAEEFGRLEEEGYLTRQNGTVELTQAGLLQVDRLLPVFFEPQHRGTRYT